MLKVGQGRPSDKMLASTEKVGSTHVIPALGRLNFMNGRLYSETLSVSNMKTATTGPHDRLLWGL